MIHPQLRRHQVNTLIGRINVFALCNVSVQQCASEDAGKPEGRSSASAATDCWVTFSLRRKTQHTKVFATFLRLPKIELNLLIQPTFRTRTKCEGQSHRHLGAYTSPSVQNGGQGFSAYTKTLCRRCHAQAQWLNTELAQYFTWVGRVVHQHNLSLVVILIINVFCVPAFKCKCHPPVPINLN